MTSQLAALRFIYDQLIEFSINLTHVIVRCVCIYTRQSPQDTVLAQMLPPWLMVLTLFPSFLVKYIASADT